uniref:NAD-dependent epimerase/dehydratase domain-containing protein n=1 Tax=Parascaris univalens TaxID=6257 RepID=A0A915BFD3_PARUN
SYCSELSSAVCIYLTRSMYFEEELLERDSERCRIKVCSVHPGCVPGDLYRNVFYPCRILINCLLSPFMRKAAVAGAEILATVMNDDLKGGCYYERMKSVALRPDISLTVRRRLFNRIQQTVHYWNF